MRIAFLSIHKGKSWRHSSVWLTTSVIVFFNYNKVNSSITSPPIFHPCALWGFWCWNKTERALASSVGRREGLLPHWNVISIQRKTRNRDVQPNMYPWLLMVISFPSANWARFSIEAIAAPLEIDLLAPSVRVNQQPVGKPISQSVSCSAIQWVSW